MNKQQHRFTSPLQALYGDDWKNQLREFLAQDDASLEAKYHENDTAPEPEPEPFYFVASEAAAPAVSRFAVPTNLLSALDKLNVR